MLEFQNVSYQYPSEDFDIIDHLSFAVEPGSFHCTSASAAAERAPSSA